MLNLITDPWIPILTTGGEWKEIRPDQIAEAGVDQLAWDRPDFNIACYELLIGLVYLARPPSSTSDWRKWRAPDPELLRKQFGPLATAFELNGDAYKFLQDLEDLPGKSNPVDMLFIDSAGESTSRKNKDLLVKRERYQELPLPIAAMALYTFQSQAPAGGAGNRTSMRGGGPLITLVEPTSVSDTPIWDLVWANVPEGKSINKEDLNSALPWMRPTVTSDKNKTVHAEVAFPIPAEAFFGMPRRLRLEFSEAENPTVIGVRQRPRGTNYGSWRHPLSPYYQQKEGAEFLPMHPRTGADTYRNWEGISLARSGGLRHVAACVNQWKARSRDPAKLIVAGWAMDKMTPQDIQFSRQPLFALDDQAQEFAIDLVEATHALSLALVLAIKSVVNTQDMSAGQIEVLREEFYLLTQLSFEEHIQRVAEGEDHEAVARSWCQKTRSTALTIFESIALPGLYRRPIEDVEKTVKAHAQLKAAFSGFGSKTGKVAYEILNLELPPVKSRNKKEKAA